MATPSPTSNAGPESGASDAAPVGKKPTDAVEAGISSGTGLRAVAPAPPGTSASGAASGAARPAAPDPMKVAIPLLREFKKNPTAWQLPAELADKLKAHRNELFEAVEALRVRGYSIEFHPYFGFRLGDLPDQYVAEEIQDDLNTRNLGKTVLTFESIGSTCDMAWELAEKSPDHPDTDGAVVVADTQTRGRVKLGHHWFSPKGKGVYLAVLLRPDHVPVTTDTLAYYAVAAALSVAHTLTDIVHIPAQIRWPNDVFVGARKIASVTGETRPELPGAIVVGFGINTDLMTGDLPPELRDRATSIRMEAATRFNHNRLVRYLLFYFDGLYQKLRRKRMRPVAAGLKEYSALTRQEVLVTDTAGEHRGKVKDIEPTRLILTASDGKDLTIHHSDVRELRIIH